MNAEKSRPRDSTTADREVRDIAADHDGDIILGQHRSLHSSAPGRVLHGKERLLSEMLSAAALASSLASGPKIQRVTSTPSRGLVRE